MLTPEQVEKSDQAFWDLLEQVPFGNSEFQIKQFVAKHARPGRSFRQVVLELYGRAEALMAAGAERERAEIRIDAKRRLLRMLSWARFLPFVSHKIRLLEVDVREQEFRFKSQDKLKRDALAAVKALSDCLAALPPMTRERFEAEEPEYWTERLLEQGRQELVGEHRVSAGLLETMQKMGHRPEDVRVRIEEDVRRNLHLPEAKSQPRG